MEYLAVDTLYSHKNIPMEGPGFCLEHRLKAAMATQLCPLALSPAVSHQPTGQSLLDRRWITVVKMQNVASRFLLLP